MGDEVTAPQRFSFGQWLRGSCLSMFVVMAVTIASFFGWSLVKIENKVALFAIGVLPAVVIGVLAYRRADGNGFFEGVMTGTCFGVLLSGLCFSAAFAE